MALAFAQGTSQTLAYDPTHLRTSLLSVLHNESTNGHPLAEDVTGLQVQELFEELLLSKQHLVKLFDVGPRSDQERKELESGRITVNNHPLAINTDFARQVVFVSSQLDVSERYIASLMQTVISRHPNLTSQPEQQQGGSEKLVEAAVLEFHSRRRQLAQCLRYIMDAAVLGQQAASDAMAPGTSAAGALPDVYRQLERFVRQEILTAGRTAGAAPATSGVGLGFNLGGTFGRPAATSTPGGFPLKLLREIEKLGETIERVQTARQNARTETVSPAEGREGRLGSDILSARLTSLHAERRALGVVLLGLCRLGYVSPTDLLAMVDWLERNGHAQNPMVLYVMVGILNCWDIVDSNTAGGHARKQLSRDANLISTLKRKLNGTRSGPTTTSGDWRVPGLRAVLLMKWTLFLTEMRHRDPSLEDKDGFKTEDLESQIWNSVQGDSLTYLVRVITTLHAKTSSDPNVLPTSYLASGVLARFENEPLPISGSEVEEEFIGALLDAIESLVRWLITYASSELRKIKQRQEDVLLAGVRGDRSRLLRSTVDHSRQTSHSRSTTAETATGGGGPPTRNDIAALFSLIGILYTSLPSERALQFWVSGIPPNNPSTHSYMAQTEASTGRLPGFLQWAVWSTQIKDVDVLTALYDMLVGLSKGQQCSELAYNFLARGVMDTGFGGHAQQGPAVSWSAIFGLLEQWTSTANSPKPNQPPPAINFMGQRMPSQRQHPQHPQQLVLSQQDVLLAQSFLRLLGSVVRHSVAVRTTLSSHARFRPIPTLISLIPLSIPLELKGALFDALSSFCLSGAGTAGVEICRSVWTLMERMEIINVRTNAIPSGQTIAVKGAEVELEEVETTHKLYPETIPFLKLLSVLIHTPKSISTRELVADSEPINTIPEGLGQAYRVPGIGPYTSFVVDKVFAKISHREYLRPTDRWRMNDFCLSFVENCLASFDLESLVASQEEANVKAEALVTLAVHPGCDILKRLLTNSPLQSSVLSYVVEGLEGFDKGYAEEEPLFAKTIVRVLRIIHRVLELQDLFLDIFVPALASLDESPVIGEVHPVSYYSKFDEALLYGPQSVPSLSAYISYPSYPELRLLSVKILSALATPTNVSQLAIIIDRSSDSERIIDGYQNVLETESYADVDLAETIADECTGAGAPDVDQPEEVMTQAIRLAVLEFLNLNTQPGRPYPNIAHFLLFGRVDSASEIQDPNALGARRACIHSIIDTLNDGVPRLNDDTQSQHLAGIVGYQTLTTRSPAYAERCYRVIYQLCKHSRTSEFTLRYLRSREDFVARHLSSLPYHVNPTFAEPYIEIQYNDSSRVITTVPTLTASLRLRSTIFDLVALELHSLTSKRHSKSVVDLLNLLYGNEDEAYGAETGWAQDAFRPFRDLSQSYLRMIEFLQSLDFDWSDSLSVQPVQLEFFGHLNLGTCVRTDDAGCEVVDKTALVALLTHARRALHQQGRILTPAHFEQVSAETTYILESCAIENHRRQVQHATMMCYESWRRLLDMTLVKCLEKIAPSRRESLLFDLLHSLPSALLSSNTPDATAVILAEAVLSTLTKLREDRHHQALAQASSSDGQVGSLPAERLFGLLRGLLQCLTDNSHSEIVRGNLYASLVNYVNLITSSSELSTVPNPTGDLPSSLHDIGVTSAASALVSGSLTIIKPVMERLVSLVSRDATDGTEVWKTVAFALLDSLVRLSHVERRVDVLGALARPGFITGFARSLKETDGRLQSVLKPDPEDLNPLYIYESKMSLLSRMAQGRSGAERLVEANLIPALAECDFIDARPEMDQAFVDNDSFLPSALHRYHQLLLPALQVVSGVVATLGSRHLTANNQVLDFFRAHRDTLVILLKTDTPDISVSVLEEMRLLVSLGSSVLSSVPKTELVATGGYGGVHAAIISLAARSFGTSKRTWAAPESVRPASEEEGIANSVRDAAYGVSKFRLRVFSRLIHLRKALVAYVGNACAFTEHEFSPLLSPIVGVPRADAFEGSARFSVTIPTVGDALDALLATADDLVATRKHLADFEAELDAHAHSHLNIGPGDLAVGLRSENGNEEDSRGLVEAELRRWLREARIRDAVLSESLEMLTLLVWRHLGVYAASDSEFSPAASTGGAEGFKQDAARRLGPVVQRLAALQTQTGGADRFQTQALTLGQSQAQSQSQIQAQHERYMEVMSRRLRDAAGLEGDA